MNKFLFFYVNFQSKIEDGVIFLQKTAISKRIKLETNILHLFEGTNLSEKRKSLLPKCLIKRPNIIKCKNLMISKRKSIV